MGGYGSGRSAWRNSGTVERRFSLTVNALSRAKALTRGTQSVWTWKGSDGATASIRVESDGYALTLRYTVNDVPTREVVPLEQQRCHFGGVRTWLRCPHCGRRAGTLYLVSGRFVCRRSARLSYRTQRCDLSERGDRKIRKAYRALGLDPDEAERLENLPKPKGMHWRTFQQHLEAIERGAWMRDHWMLYPSKTIMRVLAKPRSRTASL